MASNCALVMSLMFSAGRSRYNVAKLLVQWSRPDRPSRVWNLGRKLAGPQGYRFEGWSLTIVTVGRIRCLCLPRAGHGDDGEGLEAEAIMAGWLYS